MPAAQPQHVKRFMGESLDEDPSETSLHELLLLAHYFQVSSFCALMTAATETKAFLDATRLPAQIMDAYTSRSVFLCMAVLNSAWAHPWWCRA